MNFAPITDTVVSLQDLGNAVSNLGPAQAPEAASAFEGAPVLPTLAPPILPDNAQSTVLDIDEAEAPTSVQPLPPSHALMSPVADVYVAPMSTTKQKVWQKLLCIGCCIPSN